MSVLPTILKFSLFNQEYFFFLIFCILICLLECCDIDKNATTDSCLIQNSSISNEYIVSFYSYMKSHEQNRIIFSILGNDCWKSVIRSNPSLSLPSDFALVYIGECYKDALARLSTSPHIRSVVPHMLLPISLNQVLNKRNSSDSLKSSIRIRDPERNFATDFNKDNNDRDSFSDIVNASIPELVGANRLWEKGVTGKGIKVAVFDTGVSDRHPYFEHIIERTDWTGEHITYDVNGHGTFIAGVIANKNKQCPGIAPHAEIYSFRIFNTKNLSYTSWFLDAFNYAINKKINIINLSIGGPDFLDEPFVEKIRELSANNIIVVSAVGNEGPTYGTVLNPADLPDVIGVGSISCKNRVSSFSSRGMTTGPLPFGSGIAKPDILTYGSSVKSPSMDGNCMVLSGTSVSSPIISASIALLASSLPENTRWHILNPASIKQILTYTSDRLDNTSIFEQGSGKLNLLSSYNFLVSYVPHISFLPSVLDFTDHSYMRPYSAQPMYYSAQPIIFNITILNSLGVFGNISENPIWIPGENGHYLNLSFAYSDRIWPWSGWFSVYFSVLPTAAFIDTMAQGTICVTFDLFPSPQATHTFEKVQLPVKVRIVPTPHRTQRILWDQFHNINYPRAYVPHDSLSSKDAFDRNGDHPYTNFHNVYYLLRKNGYYLEILNMPFTCFEASLYSTILIVDPEEEFFADEIEKLKIDLKQNGLSLALFADWYDEDVMREKSYFDDNMKHWINPITAGSNIPAINQLLLDFDIQLGNNVYIGHIKIASQMTYYASGTSIVRFPKNGVLYFFNLIDESKRYLHKKRVKATVPVLGHYSIPSSKDVNEGSGRIAIFGDSSCLVSSFQDCLLLFSSILDFTSKGISPALSVPGTILVEDFIHDTVSLPQRIPGNRHFLYSKLSGSKPNCSVIVTKNDLLEKSNLEAVYRKFYGSTQELRYFFFLQGQKNINLPNNRNFLSFCQTIYFMLSSTGIFLIIWYFKYKKVQHRIYV